MPRLSYEALQELNRTLQQNLAAVSTDSAFGVTTREALPYELMRLPGEITYLVYADVDNLPGLNMDYGVEAANGMIRRALHVRAPAAPIRARWFGSAFVFGVSEDPEEFCQRLATCARNNGFTFTITWAPVDRFRGIFLDCIEFCERAVRATKATGRMGEIIHTTAQTRR